MRGSCKNCYFADECKTTRICGAYSPIYEPDDDEMYDYIEEQKKKFRDEFFEYVGDDYFF